MYKEFEELILINLFLKSLIASAPGWKIPKIPGLLGPSRSCLNLKILRSSKVMKATFSKTMIVKRIESK